MAREFSVRVAKELADWVRRLAQTLGSAILLIRLTARKPEKKGLRQPALPGSVAAS